jgi:hypothetical protein
MYDYAFEYELFDDPSSRLDQVAEHQLAYSNNVQTITKRQIAWKPPAMIDHYGMPEPLHYVIIIHDQLFFYLLHFLRVNVKMEVFEKNRV